VESHVCDLRTVEGPSTGDWGHPRPVVCAACEAEGTAVVLGLVAQRIAPLRSTLLVPACTPLDVEPLDLRPGDWTLWTVRRLVDDRGRTRRFVAVLCAPVQFVRCPRCHTLVRLDLEELRARGPASRALVA
jgi:hypothetical protein